MGLLIKNGRILTASDEFTGDILSENGVISQVGQDIPEADHEVVDASGKYVFPGGVDEHVHMGPFDTYSFETSHAALVGGTTTIVDFSPQFEGMGIIESMEKHRAEKAEGQASSDYSFHGMVMNASEDILDEIPKLAEAGLASLKFFMAYKGTPYYSNDQLIFKAMQKCRDHGITVMLHCENGDVIEVLKEEIVAEGGSHPINHANSQPPKVEDEATERAIHLAEIADCPTFIVHVTTQGASDAIRRAQLRRAPVTAETCMHYLALDSSYLNLDASEAAKYVCSPPLRGPKHQEALWDRLNDGTLLAVSSDHAAVRGGTKSKIAATEKGFQHIPNGAPGMQDRLSMLWTLGVAGGRISKQKFVELVATNPAKISGIYPKKGSLAPGSDADIVIFDPDARSTVRLEDSYEGTDYALYEGFEKIGQVEKVYLRGQLMAEKGQLVGEKGQGEYIPAQAYALPYQQFKKKENILQSQVPD